MSQIKRRYRTVRREFRMDIYQAIMKNPALGLMIIKTYTASMHRSHIGKIWWMMRNHQSFREEYNKDLIGKHLTGRDELFHSLHFAAPEIRQKYWGKIPEAFAMGDALAAAYKAINKKDPPPASNMKSESDIRNELLANDRTRDN